MKKIKIKDCEDFTDYLVKSHLWSPSDYGIASYEEGRFISQIYGRPIPINSIEAVYTLPE